jgi:hypothetical protein
MATLCAAPIKAQVARFTLVDVCGVPITGDGSAQITSDSFTEIQNTPNYEEGQRFLLRKANGEPCVNERDAGFFNWLQQQVMLCSMDPDLLAAVTGEPVIEDFSEDSAGAHTGVIFGEGLLENHFSLEVWQPVSGEGACDPTGQQRFVYWAFPHVIDAQIQQFTFQNDTFTFGYQSITRRASELWTIGDPWLASAPVSAWGPGKHYAFNITTVAPPEPACGAIEVNES